MIGSLSYTSIDEFERDYKDAIYNEIAEMASERQWWNQAITMSESPNHPDLLTGGNQIVHRYLTGPDGSVRNVAYRDDLIMGLADYFAVVEILTYLSKAHEFGWNLCYAADPRDKLIGTIDNGEIDPRVFEFPMHEMEAMEISDSDLEDETLHSKIRKKYFPKGD